MNYWLLLIPLLGALAGWLIVRALVSFLFYPIRPIRIAGMRLQGIFPAKQVAIARLAGEYAAKEIRNSADFGKKTGDPALFSRVKPLIEAHMDDFLRNRLAEKMPMIGMFIGDKTIGSLKEIFIGEIEDLFPGIMQEFGDNLQEQIDPAQLVSTKIAALDPAKIAAVFYKNSAPQLSRLYLLAAFFGFLVGCLQLAIALFIN